MAEKVGAADHISGGGPLWVVRRRGRPDADEPGAGRAGGKAGTGARGGRLRPMTTATPPIPRNPIGPSRPSLRSTRPGLSSHRPEAVGRLTHYGRHAAA